MKLKKNKILLIHQVKDGKVNTKNFPLVLHILENKLPTIFKNKCFNYKKFSFKKEVRQTEMGHLLEHMILENLKLEAEKRSLIADYNGETTWNWEKEKYGRFNIAINYKPEMEDFMNLSLLNSISLMEEVYNFKG